MGLRWMVKCIEDFIQQNKDRSSRQVGKVNDKFIKRGREKNAPLKNWRPGLHLFIKDPLAQQRTEKLCFINAIHSSSNPPLDPQHLKWHYKLEMSITSILLKRKMLWNSPSNPHTHYRNKYDLASNVQITIYLTKKKTCINAPVGWVFPRRWSLACMCVCSAVCVCLYMLRYLANYFLNASTRLLCFDKGNSFYICEAASMETTLSFLARAPDND